MNVDEKRSAEIFETLRLWGVRTFHDFAELPIAGVSERLGPEGFNFKNLLRVKPNDICYSNNLLLSLRAR